MEASAPTSRRVALVLPALALIAIAVWEIIATLRATASVPDDAAWAAAAQVVRSKRQPGDLIVFAPAWIDPVGRQFLGDLISIDDAARMDADKYARIWELSIRDAHAPDVAGRTLAEAQLVDGIAVRRYERTPVTVLADLRDTLPSTTARVELAEVGFAPHRCIQATPMTLVFPAIPLGTELVGYVGIADVFTRRDVRAPAQLSIEIGGATVATASAGVDDGWVRFAARTTPGTSDVTVRLQSAAPGRLICFAAEARQ